MVIPVERKEEGEELDEDGGRGGERNGGGRENERVMSVVVER